MAGHHELPVGTMTINTKSQLTCRKSLLTVDLVDLVVAIMTCVHDVAQVYIEHGYMYVLHFSLYNVIQHCVTIQKLKISSAAVSRLPGVSERVPAGDQILVHSILSS